MSEGVPFLVEEFLASAGRMPRSFGEMVAGRLAELDETDARVIHVAALLGRPLDWPLLARVTDRIGKGVRGAPRDALIADETTPANRGRAFGFHRAADTAGAVIGPLIALVAYQLLGEQLRPLLWIAVVPAVISTGLVFLVRERDHPQLTGDRPDLRKSR